MTSATPDAEVLAQHEVLPSHAEGGISNPVLGMLLFITSEIMFFAGLFAAYFALRAGYTEVIGVVPTHVWPPTAFAAPAQAAAADPDHGERQHRPEPDPAGDDHPDRVLVHLPVRRVGDPARRPAGRSCATSRSPSAWASPSS